MQGYGNNLGYGQSAGAGGMGYGKQHNLAYGGGAAPYGGSMAPTKN